MQILFWTGIGVFILGFILRYVLKIKYYKECKTASEIDSIRKDLSVKYRRYIYIALGIELAGCIITFIGVFIN